MSDGPQRTCVGCRQRRPKRVLVRLMRTRSGVVRVDAQGAGPGRGAYVCAEPGCVERALRPGRLAHALRGASEIEPGLDMAVQRVFRR